MDFEVIEIAKLELLPGDLLLVRVPPNWSEEQVSHADFAVKESLRRANVDVPILFGTTDVDFQIVRKDAA